MRLGRVGGDPRFSLALSANSGGSWLGQAGAPRSAKPSIWAWGAAGGSLATLRDEQRAGRAEESRALCSAPRAAPAAATERASRTPRAPSLRPSALRLATLEKGQLEAPRLHGPPPRPGATPQARGCHRGRVESILASEKGGKEAAAIRCLTSLPTSLSFSIFYSFGFQIIGPEGGVHNPEAGDSWQICVCILLGKDQQKGDWKSGFFGSSLSLCYLGQVA